MSRWTRSNKAELARRLTELIEQGLRPRDMVKVLGKSERRLRQIRQLFGLPPWQRRA